MDSPPPGHRHLAGPPLHRWAVPDLLSRASAVQLSQCPMTWQRMGLVVEGGGGGPLMKLQCIYLASQLVNSSMQLHPSDFQSDLVQLLFLADLQVAVSWVSQLAPEGWRGRRRVQGVVGPSWHPHDWHSPGTRCSPVNKGSNRVTLHCVSIGTIA